MGCEGRRFGSRLHGAVQLLDPFAVPNFHRSSRNRQAARTLTPAKRDGNAGITVDIRELLTVARDYEVQRVIKPEIVDLRYMRPAVAPDRSDRHDPVLVQDFEAHGSRVEAADGVGRDGRGLF